MLSRPSLSKIIQSFFVLILTAQLACAEPPPVAATIGTDQVKQASIGSDSAPVPGLVSILALSVAAITMVRRNRVPH